MKIKLFREYFILREVLKLRAMFPIHLNFALTSQQDNWQPPGYFVNRIPTATLQLCLYLRFKEKLPFYMRSISLFLPILRKFQIFETL